MTTQENILSAIQEAANEAASYMTLDLRDRQQEDGWQSDVIAGTRVQFADNKYQAKIDPEVADQGFIHEYGNGAVQPLATMRKYSNSAPGAEAALLATLSDKVGGLL